MSDASPAGAVSGAEPTGQPAAEPTGQDPNKTIQETVADDRDGEKPETKPRKRPSLPGLIGGGNDPVDPDVAKAMGEEDRKAQVPARDPKTGRFKSLEAEREAELAGADDERPQLPEGAEQTPDGEKDEPKGEKFAFGGVEFDSREAAEQNFRSLRGVHKSLIERVKSEESEKLYGYKAANAWQAEAQARDARIAELEQELATYKSGSTPSGASDSAPSSDDLGDALATFEYIAKNGTITQAGEFLLTEAVKLAEAKFNKQLAELKGTFDQRLMPFESSSEQYQVAENMTRITQQMSEYRLQDGNLAFPELRDAAKLERIGEIWGEMGLPDEALRTPQGLITAIGLMRMYDGMPDGSSTPNPVPSAPRVQPGAAALSASDSRGLPDRERPEPGIPPHLQKLSREMGKPINSGNDYKKLGFARNPRS